MIYEIEFTDQAQKEIALLKKSDLAAYTKLQKLLIELMEHPYTGTGKPERMKYDFSGYYSRRITHKHRLVYSVDDEKIVVEVLQVSRHYGDK
jgi:toxin YoeB